MSIRGFGSSIFFGATAAMGLVFTHHLVAPLVGYGRSAEVLAFYLAATLVAYAALIAPRLRHRIRNVAVAGLGTLFVLMLANGIEGLAIGLGALLAVIRTGLDPQTRTLRGFCAEGVLGLGALVFASFLASPGWLGSAAALWGFTLVQSLYFLVPATRDRSHRVGERDPFERARDELLGLLDET